MMARAAEYGNDRILMGAHYAMDVIAGRTLAAYDVAHLLANDGKYFPSTASLRDFQAAIQAARVDATGILRTSCGDAIDVCARQDIGRFSNAAENEAFYESTQTYNLPAVHLDKVGSVEDVAQVAPEAGCLLVIAFPGLTQQQANQILTETEGPGGGFLDDGSGFGVYSRLNLYAAAGRATQLVASSHADKSAPMKCSPTGK